MNLVVLNAVCTSSPFHFLQDLTRQKPSGDSAGVGVEGLNRHSDLLSAGCNNPQWVSMPAVDETLWSSWMEKDGNACTGWMHWWLWRQRWSKIYTYKTCDSWCGSCSNPTAGRHDQLLPYNTVVIHNDGFWAGSWDRGPIFLSAKDGPCGWWLGSGRHNSDKLVQRWRWLCLQLTSKVKGTCTLVIDYRQYIKECVKECPTP